MRQWRMMESHGRDFRFCPANSQLYGVLVKSTGVKENVYAISRSWQMASDQLIDGPCPEDGTDFFSYAAGALFIVLRFDCCGVVVACHADFAVARPD